MHGGVHRIQYNWRCRPHSLPCKVSKTDALEAIQLVRRSSLQEKHKDSLTEMLVEMGRNRRQLQNYTPWTNYGTKDMWANVFKYPNLAGQIIAEHLKQLGLACPSEPTCASVAAADLLAQHGPMAYNLPKEAFEAAYAAAKKALKNLQLHPDPYIHQLPPTPAGFLGLYPSVAHQVFSASALPISFPMSKVAHDSLVGRIDLRGSPPPKEDPWQIFQACASLFSTMGTPAPEPGQCPLTFLGRGAGPAGGSHAQSSWLARPPTQLGSLSKPPTSSFTMSPSKLPAIQDGDAQKEPEVAADATAAKPGDSAAVEVANAKHTRNMI
jgi:hypothetical protein